jgi:hypothetical protein
MPMKKVIEAILTVTVRNPNGSLKKTLFQVVAILAITQGLVWLGIPFTAGSVIGLFEAFDAFSV